ncbi:hypothetical protein AB0K12_43700 [Nonomuraea sp. NPDC049419]|uniref:hypothetical protein n=1 Tax=Nonomuraea sp. NPDC049419 TaxID=3155772 RepID=UPI00341B90A8
MRIACALLAGYYLGRRRKLRTAAVLVAAGLAGKASGNGGGLLSQGLKTLGSSADLGQLTEQLRGGLLEAGKAATSRQIDSLSDKLHERAESLRSPGDAEGSEKPSEATGDTASSNGSPQNGATHEPQNGATHEAQNGAHNGAHDEAQNGAESGAESGDGNQNEAEREPAGPERARRQSRAIRRTSMRR